MYYNNTIMDKEITEISYSYKKTPLVKELLISKSMPTLYRQDGE